jgi:class 3 adenylate cyclase
MRNCGGCLGIVDDWDIYCRFCGRPLEAPGQAPPNLDLQQRKFATILFADIVGSTSLVHGLPPEEAIARLGPAVGEMCSIVIRHGGTVCRDQGDGLMAVFGAPTALSDHALRACRAGLEIVGGLGSDFGLAAHVRVGIHSGDIIFHHVYVSSGATYAVAGPAVHLASRLEAACRPGHVLISEATKLLVHGFVKTADSVATLMKGFNEPVNTFELSAEPPAGGWTARMNRGASPFVGRSSEIDQLTALVDGCAASVAVACLRGDAGMGKSRLARQVVRRLVDSGWQPVVVEADADNTSVPYALLASFCLACVALPQEDPIDWPADLSSLFDGHPEAQILGLALRTIRGVSVADHQWLSLESGYRRRKMFEVALALLQRRLRRNDKIVVLLEDLHWADRESLLVLGQLQQDTYDGKLFLLSTARRSDAVPDEQTWFQSGVLLDLLPFDMATSEHLLDELLGRSSELMRLKGRVLQKAGGNPMLLEEVVRWLVGNGHVQGELGNYRLASRSEDFVVPDSVRSIVLARVDQLTETCKATLRAAAILGSQFSVHQLASMLGSGVPDALMHIDVLLSASMFVPVGGAQREDDTYSFGHAIFQDCVVSALTLGTRQQLHQRALDSCVASDGVSGADHAERISRHAIEARDWVRVASYSMRAGQKAMERLAYLDAAVFFERAIDALYRLPKSAENARLAIDARLQVRISYSAASRLDLCLTRVIRGVWLAGSFGQLSSTSSGTPSSPSSWPGQR